MKILWDRLTAPAPAVERPDRRRQARLLAAVLLVILLIGIVGEVTQIFLVESLALYTGFWITTPTLFALFLAYLLSRTRFFELAAIGVVGVLSIMTFAAALWSGSHFVVEFLYYAILPVLFSSIFLSLPTTLIVFATNLILLVTVPALDPTVPAQEIPLIYYAATSGWIMLSTHHRNQLEFDRRAALMESEARYRALLETTFDGIALYKDGRLIEANSGFVHIFGYRFDEVPGTAMAKFAPPETREAFVGILESGTDNPIETLGLRKDDARIHIELVSRAQPYSERATKVVAIREITERKRAEEALRASEWEKENILDSQLERIVYQDRHHRILWPNRTAYESVGARREELIGQNCYEVWMGRDAPCENCPVELAIQTGQPHEQEKEIADGSVWFVRGYPAWDSRGRLVGGVEIIQDITEQKQTEAALRRRNRELATLYQAAMATNSKLSLEVVLQTVADQMIQALDVRGCTISLWNRSYDVLETVVDHDPFIRRHNRPSKGIYDLNQYPAMRRALKTRHPIVLRQDLELIAATELALLDQLRARTLLLLPLFAREQPVGLIKLIDDTEGHEYAASDIRLAYSLAAQAAIAIENARLYEDLNLHAQELSDALAKLRELDDLKSEFIQNVSHELRTPLSLVMGYAELLHQGELGALDAQQQDAIGIIARRTRGLSELVEDITLILEAEVKPPDPQPIALDELARAAVEAFRVATDEAGLHLQANIPDDLPPVQSTETHLSRVLDNLLGNAIKFTPRGGTITVHAQREGEGVSLEVQDTGIGISPEQQERIFQRFYQIDGSPQRRYGGVGLGLALVKEIIEYYGGRVELQSEVGQGSTFSIWLPSAQEDA
jgi:PAS domain S-box-containing protein